jgi:LPS O-antigen subunit length determinant protein (WzzB/FepE family)
MDAKIVILGLAAIAAAFGIGYYIMKEPEEGQEAAAREISVGARSLGIYCIDCRE